MDDVLAAAYDGANHQLRVTVVSAAAGPARGGETDEMFNAAYDRTANAIRVVYV